MEKEQHSASPLDITVRHELDEFRDAAITKAAAGKCEGNCVEHRGDVRAVRVANIQSGIDWGYFAYCEEAIETDTHNGMRLVDA